ncbi:MAG: selenide, water dikinase SelD [Bacteroidales bacterium]|nr:selenide, water dikinase SelD [Bacteroidales bacterium]
MTVKKTIYLDYNATTPVDKEVADTMKPFIYEFFGNPSSIHSYGIQAKKAIEKARKQVADLIKCKPEEVVFTSGGSESNNMAIKGVALANREKGNHIITTAIEHPAVLEVCRYLEKLGFSISYLPVDSFGMVDPADVEKEINPGTILVSVMHANNEVGTIQPLAEISKICRDKEVLFHSDAAQSVGKIKTDIREMGVDLMSIAGHKMYAPKGIGALYINKGIILEKLIHGADHEQNKRAGTENVLEIVGLGQACEVAGRDLEKNQRHLLDMRDRLYNGLIKKGLDIKLNGHLTYRLPNTLSIGFRDIEANTLLWSINQLAASAGAACHTDSEETSSVLMAMKVPDEYAMGTIRFSVGKYTTKDEIDTAIDVIDSSVKTFVDSEDHQNAVLAEDEVKLTHFTHGMGCACKLRPQDLEAVLKEIPFSNDPRILVGTDTSDDAAVFRIDDDKAIVQTVDFFTPVVDDPYHFGAIAAANSLSDIYAMGADPLFALNIVGFPIKRLSHDVLRKILKGAQDKVAEAGIPILGGHTIEDNEPKFGLVVSGIIHPDKIIKNSGAQSGDMIILTKPIGTGIISTGIKNGMASKKLQERVISIMSELNRKAVEIAKNFVLHACTDVTGFGLLGHLKEVTEGSGLDAEIFLNKVPLIEQVRELATANMIPGGSINNLDYVNKKLIWGKSITRLDKLILCDAQTSGGLLLIVPAETANDLLSRLKADGIKDAAIIGKFLDRGEGMISVT